MKRFSETDEGGAVVPVTQGGLVRGVTLAEIQRQIELLAGFNLPPTAVETQYVELREERGKTYRYLCKREKPMKFFLDQSKYDSVVGGLQTHLPSESFYKSSRRGRFRDEDRATGVSTVELKETFLS